MNAPTLRAKLLGNRGVGRTGGPDSDLARELHSRASDAATTKTLRRERHDLMLASLDERWWQFAARWKRRSRLAAVERELGNYGSSPW